MEAENSGGERERGKIRVAHLGCLALSSSSNRCESDTARRFTPFGDFIMRCDPALSAEIKNRRKA